MEGGVRGDETIDKGFCKKGGCRSIHGLPAALPVHDGAYRVPPPLLPIVPAETVHDGIAAQIVRVRARRQVATVALLPLRAALREDAVPPQDPLEPEPHPRRRALRRHVHGVALPLDPAQPQPAGGARLQRVLQQQADRIGRDVRPLKRRQRDDKPDLGRQVLRRRVQVAYHAGERSALVVGGQACFVDDGVEHARRVSVAPLCDQVLDEKGFGGKRTDRYVREQLRM